MVQHQVAPLRRHERREPLEEHQRLECEMGGPVIIRTFQLPVDAAVAAEREAVAGECRAQNIPGQSFERGAGAGGHEDAGMDVEAVGLGEEGALPWRDAHRAQGGAAGADVGDAPSGLRTEGDALGDRRNAGRAAEQAAAPPGPART